MPPVGVVRLPLARLRSPWHEDLERDWHPREDFIAHLKALHLRGDAWPPVLVVPGGDGFLLVNGHHRLRAALELGLSDLEAVVLEMGFDDTEPLRRAEVLLKEFDQGTAYRYQFSAYLDRWAAAQKGEPFVNRYRPVYSIWPSLRTRLRRLLLKRRMHGRH